MMNKSFLPKSLILLISLLNVYACTNQGTIEIPENRWPHRPIDLPADSLETGHSYLSIYSQIYSDTEHRTHSLTATVSIRNVSQSDTIYLTRADYYDTHGNLLKSYLEKPNYVAPLETVEIVIAEKDNSGGTGANFLFDWAVRPGAPEPYFEGIMISTIGSQGLSFTTQGIRIW